MLGQPGNTQQRFVALLFAAVILLFARIGLAGPITNEKSGSFAAASAVCCDIGSVRDCVKRDLTATEIASQPCCVQRYALKQSDVGLPSPSCVVSSGKLGTARTVFPIQPLRLSAAPSASGNTPLIYLFQRLLI